MSTSRHALLFDIDGTLADTDALHLEAFNRLLNPRGHIFDHARYSRELQGFSTQSICDRFLGDETPARQMSLMEQKEATFRELVADRIAPTPGLMALLDHADREHVPMVAVTNAPRLNAEMLLGGLKITHRFKAIVIGDELPHGKPHPLPYLTGLEAVAADARSSLAFEDSRSGITSASSAGIDTIGILTSLTHNDMIAAGAVASAEAFDDPRLLQMIASKMKW